MALSTGLYLIITIILYQTLPAWKVIKMCDKADGDMLAAQQNVDSLTHVMQEALLRVREAENRVAYWEKRKLERRIRAALRRKHCGAN